MGRLLINLFFKKLYIVVVMLYLKLILITASESPKTDEGFLPSLVFY